MTAPLLVFLAIVGLTVLIALGIKQAKVLRQKTAANLQRLAGQLGLEVNPRAGPPKRPGLTGLLGGKPTEIYSYSVSNGKTSVTWVAITVQATAATGLKFNLQKQGFGSALKSIFMSTLSRSVGIPATAPSSGLGPQL